MSKMSREEIEAHENIIWGGPKKPLNKEVANVCPKCGGKWRGDGVHQNEFCEKCFADKPGNAEL